MPAVPPDHTAARHVPAIDGLRAIAVLSVLVFHLHGTWLPGGFVGVDVFFVISGFVVSASVRQADASTLRGFVAWFYARRLLRIMPALLVCLCITALMTNLFVPKAWLSDVNQRTAVAAFFGFSNVVLNKSAGDYFAPRTEFNPFTHTWSLGVEEQFYLVFPLLSFLWLRCVRGSRSAGTAKASPLAGVLSALLAALMAASLWVCATWPATRSFFLMPARFWELGLGMLLLWHLPRWQARPQGQKGWAGLASCVALAALAAALAMADAAAFPFPWALLPVAATGALLVLVTACPDTPPARLLASAPMVAVGRISYSLYLWHWPVLVLMRWTVGLDTAAMRLAAVLLAVALAASSYRWIEQPLRRSPRLLAWPRWRLLSIGGGCVLGAAVLALALFGAQPWLSLSVTRDVGVWSVAQARPLPAMPQPCTVQFDQQPAPGGADLRRMTVQGCPAAGSAGRLFAAGDSHAGAYAAMLRFDAAASGRDVLLFSRGGCPVFDLAAPMAGNRIECAEFVRHFLGEVRSHARRGDVVFLPSLRVPRLAEAWGGGQLAAAAPDDAAARHAAVMEAAAELAPLAQAGVRIVFEAPLPVFRIAPVRCSDWFNRGNPDCREVEVPRAQQRALRAPVMAAMAELQRRLPGIEVWDPLDVLCPTESCSPYRDGLPLFVDGDHLSGYGNAVLAESFGRAAASGR